MNVRPLVIVGGLSVLVMLAVSAWAWPQIPDNAQVPIHWGLDGEADGFGPKLVGLLGLPLLTLGILALLALVPRIEPRRENLARSRPAYLAVSITALLFMAGMHAFAVLAALGSDADITAVALIGSGAMFVVIGNYLGKTRSNWFFGIRTPWTLSSERSWSRTHRFGGRVFMAIGILVIAAAIWLGPEASLWAMFAGLGVGVVGLLAYSYLVWRDDPSRDRAKAVR
jgi:uncharacterized membrane protein